MGFGGGSEDGAISYFHTLIQCFLGSGHEWNGSDSEEKKKNKLENTVLEGGTRMLSQHGKRERKRGDNSNKEGIVEIGRRQVHERFVSMSYSWRENSPVRAGHMSMSNTTKWVVCTLAMAMLRRRFNG